LNKKTKKTKMSGMLALINELWYLPRDIVSAGYDIALQRLAQELPMTIHEYPTGTTCWTWKIPEKWTCDEAFLETLDGKRIIDRKDHPLHVVSYSVPFEGVVKREDLLPHLHTHKRLPAAIPFVFKYYERDWGLCLPQTLKNTLTEEAYKVVIRSRFEKGTLKVGEVVIPGESDRSFMLAAHLCHPAMANDDLSGCMVGLDVARALLNGPKPFYTYRLLLLPETIGSVAYLSHHEELVPKMVGGLFLEMLGADIPHILQHSFIPESQVDRCFVSALADIDPLIARKPYRDVIGNDERQFNAPGVRVPMLSLSRCIHPKTDPNYPYNEYHSSFDTPAIITQKRLEASRDLVLKMLAAWEKDRYVVNEFKGEIFCSGNKIWIDPAVNPEGYRCLFDVMERCDGTRTTTDIAVELQLPFQAVWEIVSVLSDRQLVSLSPKPAPTAPTRD
jgi:aminopeptidase-like protein